MGLDMEPDSARSLGAGILCLLGAAVLAGAQCAPDVEELPAPSAPQGIDIGTGSITR